MIKLTTPFIQSYIVTTVNLESRAVTSASGANGARVKFKPLVNEMRFALKDITMSEIKMVFAMKKNFRTQ